MTVVHYRVNIQTLFLMSYPAGVVSDWLSDHRGPAYSDCQGIIHVGQVPD